MKKLSIILCLCLGIVMLISEASASFPDVDENAEYADAVFFVDSMEIMSGDSQGNFNPNKTVSRAQMAAIICRTLGETENLSADGGCFTDVPESHWANRYIVKAAELDIIGGYADGRFVPDANVTYEQAVAMIVRAVGDSEEATKQGGYPDGFLSYATKNNWLNGLFAEKGEALSRADIAIILYNYYSNATIM